MDAPFLKIILNHPQAAYFPNEILRGILEVDVKPKVKISCISLSIIGAAVINHLSKRNSCDKERSKYENYFQVVTNLFHSKDENGRNLLIGIHSFPFEFELPQNIPSSFESPEGYIRYSITADVTGDDLPVKSLKTMFTVNAIVDLNADPKMKHSASAWIHNDSCCYFLRKTCLLAVIHIQKKGYVPGECIVLNAEITNFGRRPVSFVKARLVQIIRYNHKYATKRVKRVVTEAARGCIMPRESQMWLEESLLIPPVTASFLHYCNLINLQYKLYFVIYQSEVRSTVLKLPIIIGTIPLMPAVESSETSAANVLQLEHNCPAPHHEPCFFGPYKVASTCDKECVQQNYYSPRYVTYPINLENRNVIGQCQV